MIAQHAQRADPSGATRASLTDIALPMAEAGNEEPQRRSLPASGADS